MAAFAHLKLGQRIPGGPHSVSCSLPTMRDVRGYEEKDPAVMRALSSGYPRFVVHPFARRLAEHVVANDPALRGRELWLVPSSGAATRLAAHLGATSGALVFARDGLHGLSHPVSAELSSRAKTYLQNTGGFLSSREAEDHLVRLGLLPAVHPERLYQGDAAARVRVELRGALPAANHADLFLAPSGMNAVWAAFQAASALQAARGRTVWLQLGWLYLDTIAILQRFTGGPENYIHLRNPLDLRAVEQALAAHGMRVAGVIAEVPTNPLIQTTDLPALAALCRRQGALLIVDPSIASVHHVDALPHADLVVASLTKYTASEGDLTAGLVAVNPAGRDAAALREALPVFGRQVPGYDHPDVIMTGVETRTSSPVRIRRGPDCQSVNTRGLYPAGEGAGYAGGILSAAVDGIKVAEALALEANPHLYAAYLEANPKQTGGVQ